METSSADDSAARRRTQTACEACRATKIRCQPSEQPGVCRKCLESKRECVSRTGPRIRRPRRAKVDAQDDTPASSSSAASNQPPSTFSIKFDMPAPDYSDVSFDSLRVQHEQLIDQYFPQNEDGSSISSSIYMGSSSSSTSGFGASTSSSQSTGMPSSTSSSHSIESLQGRPQFNLSSAESLLAAFRPMLPRFPCIVLPEGATVPQLAATRPFVLLAILAVGAGSRSLQGHSLYDEEFRKVLGLKFVAGGERTLELLQGLLIYCAWYPFQLRPRNKQIFHYVRMSADLVHDLELEQEIPARMSSDGTFAVEPSEEQLDSIRAYLAHGYLLSSVMVSWAKYKGMAPGFTAWTETCCDLLERHARCENDVVLAHVSRLTAVAIDVLQATHMQPGQTQHQGQLMLLGVESKLREVQQRIPPALTASRSLLRLTSLFFDMYLDGCPLVMVTRPGAPASRNTLLPVSSRLFGCVGAVRRFFDELLRHSLVSAFSTVS